MIPQSEQDVFYLFSRHHEKLGFEKVVKTQTFAPDVYAIKDGIEVKIELEFHLLSAKNHYLAYKAYLPLEVITIENGNIYSTVESMKYLIIDNSENYTVKTIGRTQYVILKSLKTIFDYIVCWDKPKNTMWNPEIPIIVLSEVLSPEDLVAKIRMGEI